MCGSMHLRFSEFSLSWSKALLCGSNAVTEVLREQAHAIYTRIVRLDRGPYNTA